MPKDKKNLHIKPTKEELEANIKKTAEEAEALKNKKPKVKEKKIVIPKEPKEEPKEPKPPVSSDKPKEPKPLKVEPPKEPDYKKKFIESTREAQILHAKNKKVNEALEEAMQIPDPTEEDLKKEYPDWEMMGDFEKKMARESLTNTRRMGAIGEMVKENKDLETWQKKVDDFVDDPKVLADNPDLEGRQDEFRLFATKPTRRNVDFKDLVSAFLYEVDTTKPPKKKGKMFEVGSGGPNELPKPKGDKISIEDARILRETDYNKYKEYLKAGKIESDL